MKRRAVTLCSLALAVLLTGCAAVSTNAADTARQTAQPTAAAETAEVPATTVLGDPQADGITTMDALVTAMGDADISEILITADMEISEAVTITKPTTIADGVTLTVLGGMDFYIESTLTNEGIVHVAGADTVDADTGYFNYAVVSVQEGGQWINNGTVTILAATVDNTDDNGPVGGQFRVNGGVLVNHGQMILDPSDVNTHGGLLVVITGEASNHGTITVNGFFLQVAGGTLINKNGGTILNNSHIIVDDTGTFTNEGTLTGQGMLNEAPMAE